MSTRIRAGALSFPASAARRGASPAAHGRHGAEGAWPPSLVVAAQAVSVVAWFVLATRGREETPVLAVAVLLAGAVAGALLLMRRTAEGLAVVAYLAAVEPAVRSFAPLLPYYFLEYVLIACAGVLLFSVRGRAGVMAPLLFYSLYFLLELAGLWQTQEARLGRALLVPSAALLMMLFLATRLRLSGGELRRVLAAYVAGAAGLAGIMAQQLTGGIERWGTVSNSEVTGGLGANQVSFLLAVGVFASLVLAEDRRGWLRWATLAAAGAMGLLMVLTFSRGGAYILSGAVAAYYLLRQPPGPRTIAALLAYGLVLVGVFQAAGRTTAGMVYERFGSTSTARTDLAAYGWQIFLENPFFGVGTGNYHVAVSDERFFGAAAGAHNELVRAAAEHGILGIAFWSLFAVTALLYAARGYRGRERAIRVTFVLVALVSMFYNGLKLITQPMLLLFALAAFSAERAARFRAARARRALRTPPGVVPGRPVLRGDA